jgi:hypothetical protein
MASIATALNDLLNEGETPIEEAVSRHFSDLYRQRTDGSWDDREGFLEHMRHLRRVVASIDVTVLDEFETADSYADRHIAHVTKTDGKTVTQEVYLFGRLARDGRFDVVEEVTMMIAGDEEDRGIGQAR